MNDFSSLQDVDPTLLKLLYENHLAILVIEGLPVNSEFGIDLAAFRIGDKFKGAKLIPPGIHFVFASAVDKEARLGPRCGFFHNFLAQEILIKRWSSSNEEFDQSFVPDSDHLERYRKNLRDLDSFLGAYPFSTYKIFRNITSKITPRLLQELVPSCSLIRSVLYLVRDEPQPGSSGRLDSQTISVPAASNLSRLKPSDDKNLLPDLKPANETLVRFTTIPKDHSGAEGLTDAQSITNYYLDSSSRLKQVFNDNSDLQRLLGELQFSFITLLLGHVYDSFEHWCDLIELVSKAESFIEGRENFFREFLVILGHQMEQVSEELFEDISDINNRIRCHLDTLFQNIEQLSIKTTPGLDEEVGKLRALTEQKFGWVFDLERDDEQPVVVDID